MNGRCIHCGSMAINEHLHGRKKGVRPDECDVCYWRTENAKTKNALEAKLEGALLGARILREELKSTKETP